MPDDVYIGECHCGSIGFRYLCAVDPRSWTTRACQCSFCRAHDALSTSHPDASIEFLADNADALQRYRFGLKTADFLLCRQCGVYIGALIETRAGQFGIINTHALRPQPDRLATPAPVRYDDENTAARISRREERWSPVSQAPS